MPWSGILSAASANCGAWEGGFDEDAAWGKTVAGEIVFCFASQSGLGAGGWGHGAGGGVSAGGCAVTSALPWCHAAGNSPSAFAGDIAFAAVALFACGGSALDALLSHS